NNTEHANKVNLDSGNPVDQKGQNSIKNRQPRIRELFLGIMPDVIGLQECGNWHDFLKSDSALLNEGYRLLSAQKDSKVSIYYNSNKLEALESGSIWLTEDPENLRCSVLWNSNGNPRLAHFVRFSHKDSGETFIVVNTHIGFENTTLHYNQTRVVAEYCAQLKEKFGDPVICVGDFNEKKGSDMYEGFVNEFAGGFMEDTKFAATESSTGSGSFHALGARALDAYAIDQIMVSEEDFLVYTYRVDYTYFGNGDLRYSDHCGVVATMAILPNEE
ncbi:MAG: endonuclease/exonuclease/phosphatase family protein, partial [Clostridia bacterium]|nr:endonuclease/exonuclease/phosphatase family protein [Clostridia bacterium]